MSLRISHTRYVSSFINEAICDFVRYCLATSDLSLEEVIIVSLIAAESSREGRKDPLLIREYGTEDVPFPAELLTPVSVKFVHLSLGLSRETARRRLENLSVRGYLKRVKGGYVFPTQTGSDDYTFDLRKFHVRKLEELSEYIKKIPE